MTNNIDRWKVSTYYYIKKIKHMKKKYWHKGKTPEDMKKFNKDEIIYNLSEDIQCLKERVIDISRQHEVNFGK